MTATRTGIGMLNNRLPLNMKNRLRDMLIVPLPVKTQVRLWMTRTAVNAATSVPMCNPVTMTLPTNLMTRFTNSVVLMLRNMSLALCTIIVVIMLV